MEVTESTHGTCIDIAGTVSQALQTKGLDMALVEFIKALAIGSGHSGVSW